MSGRQPYDPSAHLASENDPELGAEIRQHREKARASGVVLAADPIHDAPTVSTVERDSSRIAEIVDRHISAGHFLESMRGSLDRCGAKAYFDDPAGFDQYLSQ